jgi:hypothetical protein
VPQPLVAGAAEAAVRDPDELDAAIAATSSGDPSSTTTTSRSVYVCASRLSRQAGRYAAVPYAGTTMLTNGDRRRPKRTTRTLGGVAGVTHRRSIAEG